MLAVTAFAEPSTWNEAAAPVVVIWLLLAKLADPDSPLEMRTWPVLTVTPPLKLYAPELLVRVMPVPAVCEVTRLAKVMVARLSPVAPPLMATLVRLKVLADPELRLTPVTALVTLTLVSEKIDVAP